MPGRANAAAAQRPPAPPPRRLAVYQQLRGAIDAGTFAPGSRLPPSREQAIALGVSRNTLLWALERLRAEGYVRARVGDGSYVSETLARAGPALRDGPGTALQDGPGTAQLGSPGTGGSRKALPPPASGTQALSRRGVLISDTGLAWQPPLAPASAFRIGAPDTASFPFALWDRLQRQASTAQRQARAQYLDPAGLPALREAIAQWLWVSRGVRCDAVQVLVTSGSQQAIDLVARLLLDPGDEVLVEDPGYGGIRASLASHGAQVRPVPVDGDGLCIARASQRWPAARLAVVTPTHQYPLGQHMSLDRRLALIAWARRQGTWLVEDDYDGEFQYGTHRTPALCSLPHGGRVLYIGTFSKSLHPGLRLGFIVLPAGLLPAFAAAKALSDRHSPGETQAALARFITDGHLLRHLRRMRDLYWQRQGRLIQGLADASDGALRLVAQPHGMHLTAEIDVQQDDQWLSHQAAALGVWVAPLSRYALQATRRGWLFGYAAYGEAETAGALDRIAPLLRRALR